MFKLNLKIAWRNLWKNKLYASINISGLAIGLTAFVLLLLYVNYEESYDTWSPDLKDVYQVRAYHTYSSPDNRQYWQTSNESRIAALLKQNIPQISAITKVENDWYQNYALTVKGRKSLMVRGIRDADSAFFNVMPYRFLKGNGITALNKPKSIVLKKEVALRLFDTEDVIGKTISIVRWEGDALTDFTITGVVDEPVTPQSVNFSGIIRTGMFDKDDQHPSVHKYTEIYARLFSKADLNQLNENIRKVYTNNLKSTFINGQNSYADYLKSGNVPDCKLLPINEAHQNPPFTAGWTEKIKPVSLIVTFLLLISIINFINLATAQSFQRAKEVGVKKVLGSNKGLLMKQFLMETGLQSLFALLICGVLIELFLPVFNEQLDLHITFWSNQKLFFILLQLFGLFLIITLLAGFYPAKVLSNYKPATVLKGVFSNSHKGLALRNLLIVLQFVISVTLIIAIGIMQRQVSFMNQKDLGFDKSRVINISTNYNEKIAKEIRRVSGVQYVGSTTQVIGNTYAYADKINFKGKKLDLNMVTVTMEAFPALGIKPLQGRLFSSLYKQDTVNTVVLNESAAKALGGNVVGQQFRSYENVFQIIGVIKDYHAESFDKTIIPTIYKVTYLGGMSSNGNLLVRFNSDQYEGIIRKIEEVWKKYYPNYPMNYESLSHAFTNSLAENNRFMNMMIIFSVVSVSLSLSGLFALSTFVSKRRTKEIAVRKVLGASNMQIVNLLNKSFLILVMVANLISWPVAYILIKKWLDGFVYRIDMPVLPFIMATITSVVIAVLTVSIQARKAAIANPVKSLKYE
ncbi:ABC transporter permease [Pedobacter sp. AJM]|uniref:ABC transporter permease n=1 Tax=Pedobacter sp. AJM TaxID=2003629 RepID=UPI000B4AC37D|nr:ABC transporter permease [Pedobacter sp. AJM]OWK69165.1 hypothetical protein CBW18_17880 [Pedobacter sp. AJM]